MPTSKTVVEAVGETTAYLEAPSETDQSVCSKTNISVGNFSKIETKQKLETQIENEAEKRNEKETRNPLPGKSRLMV